MKRNLLILGAVTALVAGITSAAKADQTTPIYGLHQFEPSLVAFQNATLVLEPGKELKNATLVIENGMITSIEKNNRAPKGARVIDATGHYIYAGFIDPYSNYGVEKPAHRQGIGRNTPPQYSNKREGGNASNGAIHARQAWADTFKPSTKEATGYIQQGFTSVQSARLDGVFQGQSATVSLAQGLPNDLIYNAQAAHFGSFDKGSSTQQYPSSLMGSIALVRQALSDTQWYQQAQGQQGSHGAIEYNADLAALTNLKSKGIIFHTNDEQSLLRASRVFQEFSVPVTLVGSGYEYAVLPELKQAKAQLILPLNYPAAPNIQAQFDELDVNLGVLRHWERAPSNPAAVAQEGLSFAFTLYDLENKTNFLPHVRKAIQHGLSKQDALAALTTHPANMAGISNQAGRIAVGLRADLVVAKGDLFEQGSIQSVWLQGVEHQQHSFDDISFAGTYTVSNQGTGQAEIVISSALLPQIQFNEGEQTARAKHVQQTADALSFQIDLSMLGAEGIHRVVVQQESQDVLIAKAQAVDGTVTELHLQAVATNTETAKSSPPTVQAPTFVGQLTYPNIAFGKAEQPQQQNLHIKNATLWTSDQQGVLEQADLLIRQGVIQGVGPRLKTPKGYTVIDGTGLHVTPGIIDEHSHIAISQGVNEGTDAITSETRIGDVVNPNDIQIYRSLAGGTTIAHLLHGSANPVGAQGQVIKLRWGQNAQQLKFTQAPSTIKMALGENVKQSNWGDLNRIRYPQTRMGVAAILKDYFQQAKEYEQEHKAYAALSRSARNKQAPPRTDYRLQSLLEIVNGERYPHVHSYVSSEILALMDVVEELGFRIHTFTHILEGYKVADELKEHGARASTFADWWAYKFEAYDAIPQNACLMMEKGVLTTVNSDSQDLQRRLNTEAAKSVGYCGMSEEEALKMVTLYPAMQLEVDDYVGSLTVGKHADFVIWNAHPLTAYAQVQQTWVDGRKYFDREEDLKMRQSIAEERRALVAAVLEQGTEAQRGNHHQFPREQPEWHCEDNLDTWWMLNVSQHAMQTGAQE